MTLEAYTDFASEILDTEIPPILLEGLNLGVIINPELKRSVDEPNRIIKGQYVVNRLGNQIILHYGTFNYLYANRPESLWQEAIRATIKHEFIHHIERLAGQDDLAKKEQIESYIRKHKPKE